MSERELGILKDLYLTPLKPSNSIYIGVELEFPVVNLKEEATNVEVSKGLMDHLIKNMAFKSEKEDGDGRPVQLINDQGDRILFEVSYNTLEFAFARAKTIQEVEARWEIYLEEVQAYLRAHSHAIQGKGIHPHWKLNDNRAVKLPRYQMLLNYLALSKKIEMPSLHDFPEYASFICGNQVQLDINRNNYLRVINAFNKIEGVKALLFANSEFNGADWDTKISRDRFWEDSMHGLLPENAGVNARDFHTAGEFLEHLGQTALFSVERGGAIYYFEPIKAVDYLAVTKLSAYDPSGNRVDIIPSPDDFQWHRSYQYQDLTKRGTVEFRSVCAQPLDQTFAPTAFHTGLLANLEELEEMLSRTDFLRAYQHDYKRIRRIFSQKTLTPTEYQTIRPFAEQVLSCAIQGLKKRGYGEEGYLSELWRRLD